MVVKLLFTCNLKTLILEKVNRKTVITNSLSFSFFLFFVTRSFSCIYSKKLFFLTNFIFGVAFVTINIKLLIRESKKWFRRDLDFIHLPHLLLLKFKPNTLTIKHFSPSLPPIYPRLNKPKTFLNISHFIIVIYT